jgi:hypothetical protein
MLILGRVLVFVALWLIFESAVSWFATCQPIYQGAANHGSNEDNCTFFSGPVASIVYFSGTQLFRSLHIYEHELIAGFTIILAFSTIGLWLATYRLYQAGERQIRTSRQIGAVQAGQTRRQLTLARETAERQLRAYVVVQKSEIRNFPPEPTPVETVQAHVIVKNAGQTPAYDVISWIGMGLEEFPPKEPPPQPTFTGRPSKTVIGPGLENHLTIFLEKHLQQEHLAALSKGTHALHVVGGIRYLDAFGKERHTTFNLFYGGSYGLNTGRVLNHGPEGNEAT